MSPGLFKSKEPGRRTFLSTIAAVAATAVLDPERALWRPGAKKIFIPPPRKVLLFRCGDIITIPGRYAVNPITGAETQVLQCFTVINVSKYRVDLWPNGRLRRDLSLNARIAS